MIAIATLAATLTALVSGNLNQKYEHVNYKITTNPKYVPPKVRNLEYTPGKYNTKGGPVADKLNVHLVPHTHDDVGWLKTVDQYYWGANNSLQVAAVQYILDSVILSLEANPDRKFIYVESAFFKRWWDQQDDATKNQVRGFVKQGRLEFINGGWCMDDEAAPNYVDMIDQSTLGHQFLLKEFGQYGIPTVGWQIDPFGHSAAQATLYALMGMNAWFFGRIDYQDRQVREKNRECEVIMRGSSSLGAPSDIFTGVMRGYGPPSGFYFEVDSNDPPIMDDPRLVGFNVDERVALFINRSLEQAEHYLTNNIMFTMGTDFNYINANSWYKNLDKLIHYVNQDSRINAFYSTPSIYLKAKRDANASWPTKQDDWFPYADSPHAFWTGYFVSRPAVKAYVRSSSAYFQICRQLEVIAPPPAPLSSQAMWEAMGVAQHHDAVSGTEKQHVANDYSQRIAVGAAACKDVVDAAFSKLVAPTLGMKWYECPLLNESKCGATTDGGSAAFLVYNPLPRVRQEYFRVPVLADRVSTVYDAKGNKIPTDFFPVIGDSTLNTAVFQVAAPPLGFSTYFLSVAAKSDNGTKVNEEGQVQATIKDVVPLADTVVESDLFQLVFSGTNGHLAQITNKRSKVTTKVDQYWAWYNSSDGNVDKDNNRGQASGAYIFRPNCTENTPQACDPFVIGSGKATVTVRNASNVIEVVQVFGDWASQIIRLYRGEEFVEVEYNVGPIPFKDDLGKEVVAVWRTDIASAQTFFTDSNGRDMQKRRINFRPSWSLKVTDPVSGNFYPVNHAIAIRDSSREFAILTDRSQGGASLRDGEVQLMVHRRTLYDDRRGVEEPINETGVNGLGLVITGTHRVLFGAVAQATSLRRVGQDRVTFPMHLHFTPFRGTIPDWVSSHTTTYTGSVALPANIHLLSLHDNSVFGKKGTAIFRLAHQFEVGEDEILSKPVSVNLTALLTTVKISACSETSLTGNQAAKDMEHYSWKLDKELPPTPYKSTPFQADTVTINPMQIRTFICNYA